MRDDNIKVEKTIALISSGYQTDIKKNTLSFLCRKRECIKMIASLLQIGC